MVALPRARVDARRLYLGTWAAYGALWATLNLLHGGSALRILVGLVAHVGVGALSGLAVAWLGQRLLRHFAPLAAAVGHVGLALLNSAVWTLATAAVWGGLVTMLGRAPHSWAALWSGPMRLQWQLLAGVLAYASVGGYTQVSLALERLDDERHRRLEAEALEATARLAALRARLDPHFLFNTLHSLQVLAQRGSAQTSEALAQLSRLLRSALRTHKGAEFVPLAEEWALVRDYIGLERFRLGERMRFIETVDEDALDVLVPAFCIQPLVENAIVHGIAGRPQGGTIQLQVDYDGDRLRLRVHDDGVGALPAEAEGADGVGLSVLRARLRVLYNDDVTMNIDTAPGRGFRVEITLPLSPP